MKIVTQVQLFCHQNTCAVSSDHAIHQHVEFSMRHMHIQKQMLCLLPMPVDDCICDEVLSGSGVSRELSEILALSVVGVAPNAFFHYNMWYG